MTYIDLEIDVACTKQPLTTELKELGAYPPLHLLGYLDELEDSPYALSNLTESKFYNNTVYHFSLI